jgi:hypothetical protein
MRRAKIMKNNEKSNKNNIATEIGRIRKQKITPLFFRDVTFW